MAHRFEPGAELRHRLAHALGHRPHLAVVLGQQHHDAVGLAELVRAQHDAGVAVQARGHREPLTSVEPAEAAVGACRRTSCDAPPSRCVARRGSAPGTIGVGVHQLAVRQLPHQRRRQPVVGPEDQDEVGLGCRRCVQRRVDSLLVDDRVGRDRCGGPGELDPPVARAVDDDRATAVRARPCPSPAPVTIGAAGRIGPVGPDREPRVRRRWRRRALRRSASSAQSSSLIERHSARVPPTTITCSSDAPIVPILARRRSTGIVDPATGLVQPRRESAPSGARRLHHGRQRSLGEATRACRAPPGTPRARRTSPASCASPCSATSAGSPSSGSPPRTGCDRAPRCATSSACTRSCSDASPSSTS